jgi:hypothetical protein
MGRETRQSRRQRQRRQAQKQQQQASTNKLAIGAGVLVIAAVIAILGYAALMGNHSTNTQASTSALKPGKSIDRIQCNSMEQATFHVHQHLDIIVNGVLKPIPAYVGFNINHDCLYWLHTHNPAEGVIHLEAPKKVVPQLGNFFDVWHQPLSRSKVWKYSVKPGEKMKVYVNGKLYNGNPRSIKLVQHAQIVIEVGPKFVPPPTFNFAKFNL